MTELATPPVGERTDVTRISHWIGGRSVAGEPGRQGAVFNPATGTQTGAVDLASVEEVDRAVQSARRRSRAGGGCGWRSGRRSSSASASSCTRGGRRPRRS